ncbi:MAG: DUF3857 and transglutaminase domain-containing protein [Candidatus Zixiibacteriota bacterium]
MPAVTAQAQPDWLKEAARQTSTAAPHKDAPTLVIHHSREAKVDPAGGVTISVCWAARILKVAGAEASAFAEHVTTTRKVKDLKGWLIGSDGKKSSLDKSRAVEVDADRASGHYDDNRRLIARFPEVKPGDIVAYEYTIEDKDPLAGYHEGFVFQVSDPVAFARFSVQVPPDWQVQMSSHHLEPAQYRHQGGLHEWTVRDLAYRPDEPYMPPWTELSRTLRVACFNSKATDQRGFADWRAAATWARRHQDTACVDTDAVGATVDQLCGHLASPHAKLRAIADFARDQIRYVAVEIGIGRFRPRAAGTTLANRYGDCKDKVALMRAMLTRAGINSAAALASVQDRVDPGLSSPFQFDHAIVAIPIEAVADLPPFPEATVNGWLYFDPTDEAMALGRLPSHLGGSCVLKLSPDDTTLTRLPDLAPRDNARCYRATAELNADFSMRAAVTVVDYRIRADETAHLNHSVPLTERTKAWHARFANVLQNPSVTDLAHGAGGDSAWTSFVLKGSNAAPQSGPYRLLITDFFHEGEFADLTAKERFHPVTFGDPAEIVTDIVWRLPPGWAPAADPERITDSCALASIDCRTELDSGIHLVSRLTVYGGSIGVEKYEQAKRVNKSWRASHRMRSLLSHANK